MKEKIIFRIQFIILVFIGSLCLHYHTYALHSPNLAQLKELIKKKEYPQAYALSKKLLKDFEGNSEFDFLYGLAARQNQHPDEAYFAFERILIQKPDDQIARLELVKTHLALGELNDADIQLRILKKMERVSFLEMPLDDLQKKIDEEKRKRSFKVMTELSYEGGYDSNANSATVSDFINTLNGSVPLSPQNKQTKSYFNIAQVNTRFSQSLDNKNSWYANLGILNRDNFSSHQNDMMVFTAAGGYQFTNRPFYLSFPIKVQHLLKDAHSYVTVYSAGSELNYDLIPNHQVGIFAFISKLNYRTVETSLLDTNPYVLGFTTRHGFEKIKTILILQLFYERQAMTSSNIFANQFSQKTYGASALAKYKMNKNLAFHGSAKYELGYYDTANAVLSPSARRDQTGFLVLGGKYDFNNHWAFKLNYIYINNQSNINVYAYRRHQVFGGLAYQF